MVSVLDIGFLQNFSHIFTFLLIFTVLFGGMKMTGIFKSQISLQAFTAFLLALISLLSSMVVKTVTRAAPWFVVVFIFSIFILIAFKTFGYDETQLKDSRWERPLGYMILTVCLLITLGAFFSVLSEEQGGVPGPGLSEVRMDDGSYVAPKLAPGEEYTPTDMIREAGARQPGQTSEFWNTLFDPKVLGMALLLVIALVTVLKLSSETD